MDGPDHLMVQCWGQQTTTWGPNQHTSHFFINKVLSELGHTPIFRYCPQLLLCLMAKFFATGTMSARNLRHLILAVYREGPLLLL